MNQHQREQLRTELRYFTGSETFYRNPLFPLYLYTEGIKHLAEEAGAYWLLDHIFAHQNSALLKEQRFQTWKLWVTEDHKAQITVTDGNDRELEFFRIEFTDFPLKSITLWLVDQTLLLPSEY